MTYPYRMTCPLGNSCTVESILRGFVLDVAEQFAVNGAWNDCVETDLIARNLKINIDKEKQLLSAEYQFPFHADGVHLNGADKDEFLRLMHKEMMFEPSALDVALHLFGKDKINSLRKGLGLCPVEAEQEKMLREEIEHAFYAEKVLKMMSSGESANREKVCSECKLSDEAISRLVAETINSKIKYKVITRGYVHNAPRNLMIGDYVGVMVMGRYGLYAKVAELYGDTCKVLTREENESDYDTPYKERCEFLESIPLTHDMLMANGWTCISQALHDYTNPDLLRYNAFIRISPMSGIAMQGNTFQDKVHFNVQYVHELQHVLSIFNGGVNEVFNI